LSCEEFVIGCRRCDPQFPIEAAKRMFWEADVNLNEALGFEEFVELVKMPEAKLLTLLQTSNRCDRGLLVVHPNKEPYFGHNLGKHLKNSHLRNPEPANFSLVKSQHFAMELYESRIASMQRYVAMTVMFHQMGYRVERFFERISFGLLGYHMDRSHSMVRIATTASPVSGADVRDRMATLRLVNSVNRAVAVIRRAWLHHKHNQQVHPDKKSKSL